MKKQKKNIHILLVLVMLFTLLPTNFTYASSPSQWAEKEIQQAKTNQLTTTKILSNYQQNITREEFAELAVKLYESLSQKKATPVSPNPFIDTKNPEILKANKLGIVGGISANQFAPNQPITRQEICVMLLRTIKIATLQSNYSIPNNIKFSDEKLIASWALDAVKYLNHQGIMGGIGGNQINPKGNTTREQAIVLVNRTFEKFSKSNKDTLNISLAYSPFSLDPHLANDHASFTIIGQMFDTLVLLEDDKLVPGLAESWKQIDPLTYEFKIRKNVKFHNGATLTAKDVAFSLRRCAGSNFTNNVLEKLDIKSIKVIDDNTVRFSTKEPYSQIINRLTHINTSIIHEASLVSSSTRYNSSATGTGAYQLVSKSLTQVKIKSFDQHYKGKANIPNVSFSVINNPDKGTEAITNGTIDIAYHLSLEQLYELYDVTPSDFNLALYPGHLTTFIGINNGNPNLSNPKVRRAINYATAVEYLGEYIFEDFYYLPAIPTNPLYWGANNEIEPYSYDISYAKRLIKEAGFEKGFDATFYITDSWAHHFIAESVKEDLAEINIDLEIVVISDWGEYLDAISQGKPDFYLLNWMNYAADIDYALYPLFHSSSKSISGNGTNYSNPEVDILLELARQTDDSDLRRSYYEEVQALVDFDSPLIVLWYDLGASSVNKKITGLKLNYLNYFNLREARFK